MNERMNEGVRLFPFPCLQSGVREDSGGQRGTAGRGHYQVGRLHPRTFRLHTHNQPARSRAPYEDQGHRQSLPVTKTPQVPTVGRPGLAAVAVTEELASTQGKSQKLKRQLKHEPEWVA